MKKIRNLPVVDLMPFSEINEKRPVLLVTSAPAWNAVKDNLHFNIATQLEVIEANTAHWDDLKSKIANRQSEIVYAVGGGLVADAAKYFAVKPSPVACFNRSFHW